MLRRSLLGTPFAIVGVLLISEAGLAGPPTSPGAFINKRANESVARRALIANPEESANAIAELRSMGPDGLRLFLEANSAEIEASVNSRAGSGKEVPRSENLGAEASIAATMRKAPASSSQSDQVLSALDSICAQKDCYASRLYWYTDLEQAKTAARAQHKPILSLRLLGRLDEDLSCANSRLFRIALYASEQVSWLLRESFILHWQSVRAVPKVTIDFGDGRTMERTLTGNSIHYVLDAEGRLIDALPGMYGPGAFLRELGRSISAAKVLASFGTDEERQTALRRYHEARLNELETQWLSDLKRAGLALAPSREIPRPGGSTVPSAQRAASTTVAKALIVERPVLRGMSDNPMLLDSIGNDAGWRTIAGLHAEDATLDEATRALMSFKDPALRGASLQGAVTALERAISEDTVRNDYVFRSRIHRWLAAGAVSSDVGSLNEKIYAELFLTPSWDAWLGLRPVGSYSGIDNDGVRK
jgi:hypothetical protein